MRIPRTRGIFASIRIADLLVVGQRRTRFLGNQFKVESSKFEIINLLGHVMFEF